MNKLKLSAAVILALMIGACDVVNEKIEVADEAANRAVSKLDNSKINQSINNTLNSVGDKATGYMPEAVRPPPERLGTDETPVLGVNPDPEVTTPINTQAGQEQAAPISEQPAADGPSGTGVVLTDAAAPGMPPPIAADQSQAAVMAPPPMAAALDSSAVELAERELARAAGQGSPNLPGDMVELKMAGVTLKRVNIRLGPGTDHDIIDTIEAGTPLRVAGRTSNDWLLIERDGQPFGFILASLVKTAS